MAIPDFQTLMLPLLKLLADKQEHAMRDVTTLLSDQFHLTEDERNLSSEVSGQGVMYNRAAWAKTYLKRAGLIEQPRRGVFQISMKGVSVLKSPPPAINLKFLEQFPEYVAAREGQSQSETSPLPIEASVIKSATPDELIASGVKSIRANLISEILDQIRTGTPFFFEKLVVNLFVKMGYGGAQQGSAWVTGRSGDGGIDGVIHEDKLGLDVIYIQAKRWKEGNTVGGPDMQQFVGALATRKAKKGIFVTASEFTKAARDVVSQLGHEPRVVLIDGVMLANLMIDYNVGVSVAETYEIKKIDSDYFLEE
jgi:restriction system protein